jgi:large subunit ribosomal protein L22
MKYLAKHRFADVAPRKMRPFAQLIRGRRADEALEALRFYPNRGARLIEAVLKSALGNAEDRGARNIDDLVVVESRIDGGPIRKRIQPRARGTAYPIKKRYAHIVIAVGDEGTEE